MQALQQSGLDSSEHYQDLLSAAPELMEMLIGRSYLPQAKGLHAIKVLWPCLSHRLLHLQENRFPFLNMKSLTFIRSEGIHHLDRFFDLGYLGDDALLSS